MNRVQQEHQFGCQVAVLAMILGVTYKEALSYYPCDPDSCNGFSQQALDNILVDSGYAVGRKYKFLNGNKLRDPWPVAPFADVHWCQVVASAGAHAVIMLRDGTVLDPWDEKRTSLNHPDYREVHFIAGVYKV